MTLAARLDDLGNPAWIALTVVGFLIWWPLGLVALGYLVGSGRLARWTGCGARGWHNHTHAQSNPCGWWSVRSNSSGNRAFDEYRTETLRRLEEEQREFKEFLNRLRHAKDKAEFDQFMAERGHRPQGPTPQPGN
ncbi:MAG: DUF2852 domain-containing protein [Alphaproteobacteria bacterium]|nr:DUF2852 domain-containing protein [Alphaproteobacteria bacterium]